MALDTRLLALIVFAFASLLYANTLRNDFVWDDRALVLDNAAIRTLDVPTVQRLFTAHFYEETGRRSGFYRPVSALSIYADYQLFGTNPAGYHATNMLLHAGVCVAAFALFIQLFGNVTTALVAALLFAAFPPHTENVAWISGRTDVLAMLFILLSLSAYVWLRQKRRRVGWALSLAAFAAAVLSKEIAVVTPLLVAVIEAGPFSRVHSGEKRWTRALLSALPFLVIAAAFLLVRHAVLGTAVHSYRPYATGIVGVGALALSLLARYAVQLVFPMRLSAEAEFPVPESFVNAATISGLLLLIAGVVAVYRYRRRADVVFASTLFTLGLLPVLHFVPATEVSADRFLYLPSLGYVLALAIAATAAVARWRAVTIIVLAVVIAAFSVRTVARNRDWRDELTLFRHTVATQNDSARAHLNLGNVLSRNGHHRQALVEFQRALELDPDYAGAWSSAAGAYKELGEINEAFRCMRRALALEPANSDYLNSVGILHVEAKRYREAVMAFELAIKFGPGNVRARYNLGVARFHLDDYEGALRDLDQVPHKDAEHVLAWFYMAESAARLGRNREAARHAGEFLRHYPHEDQFVDRARSLLGETD